MIKVTATLPHDIYECTADGLKLVEHTIERKVKRFADMTAAQEWMEHTNALRAQLNTSCRYFWDIDWATMETLG